MNLNVIKCLQCKGYSPLTFPVKSQRVNSLAFGGHNSIKPATDNIQSSCPQLDSSKSLFTKTGSEPRFLCFYFSSNCQFIGSTKTV